jgi:hypothetical protein
VRAAAAAPRLLLGGWDVTRVDEWSAGTGEMTFSKGDRRLELSWSPARVNGSRVGAAKDPDLDVALEVRIAGARATVRRYAGTDDYTAVWRSGDATVQARALAASPDEFIAVVRRFEQVGPHDWLSALPAGAVTPTEHRDEVDRMLTGLPIPPGLDVEALRTGAETRDRYQLGAKVAGAVACGWIGAWVKATAAGDRGASERAADALATARDWPILHEMAADGDYADVLLQYAGAVARGGTIDAEKPAVGVAESYADALCG